MSKGSLVIIIIFAFIVGFVIYREVPFNYSTNVIPFWQSNFEELNLINTELNSNDVTPERKQELLKRKQEIKDILYNFFGTNEIV